MYEVLYTPGSEDEEEEPGFLTKIITVNGLLGGGDETQPLEFRIEVLEVNGGADVRVSPINSNTPEMQEAGKTLLQLIQNTIA